MEKHAACAAAISSSGLVPVPSSKRDLKENCPSAAPPPRAKCPSPSLSAPVHFAVAVFFAMLYLLVADRYYTAQCPGRRRFNPVSPHDGHDHGGHHGHSHAPSPDADRGPLLVAFG